MSLDLQSETQLWLGTFEREIGSWLRQFAAGAEIGIDVGAGHGEYTLFLLTKTQASRIWAFEPDEATVALLRQNLALNGQGDSERLTIVPRPAGCGANEVALNSLDIPADRSCFVKIDVEGFESSVLRSAQNLLRGSDVRFIIETHSADQERECLEILRGAKFHTRIADQGWWRMLVPENRPIVHNRWLMAWKNRRLLENAS
ncbi:MAG: FkbM family methyltransferase [Bryobacteraceae bacterium]